MALAVVYSRALAGVDAPLVTVEVHLSGGLPAFNLVGLPDTEVREARDRVRAALNTAQFEFPARKITVNLAPADLPKESGRFDLPIALGILAAMEQIPPRSLAAYEFAGELALTGQLRPVRGALPMMLAAHRDGRAFVLPQASVAEAALVSGASAFGARSLLEVCAHLGGSAPLQPAAQVVPERAACIAADMRDVRGQPQAKRALEIAAAGAHSIAMIGPPGSGKSMLAQRLPAILPPLTESEALENAAIASLAGAFSCAGWGVRPFRAPHHTASAVALVGGGSNPRPGEISLAHNGVLFLDELPEWSRSVLEVLREPLESGTIHISRAARQSTFPAQFQLVTAMNPCPCGWLGDASGRCCCTPDQVLRYRARVSGPLVDRLDLAIEVPGVPPEVLTQCAANADGESSLAVRERVLAARASQQRRQGVPNARLAPDMLDRHGCPDREGSTLLSQALARMALSARSYHRVLKVARTIADLAGDELVSAAHIAEALSYRHFDSQRAQHRRAPPFAAAP
jgi:magnesium chelatase family protein